MKGGDGVTDDFALLCVILCLLKIFSYLTCALLYSPLHQVQPLFPTDSYNHKLALRVDPHTETTKHRDGRNIKIRNKHVVCSPQKSVGVYAKKSVHSA